jgi:hypothetical protein
MRPQILLSMFMAFLVFHPLLSQPLPLREAEDRYLDAWDLQEGNALLQVPSVSSRDRATLKWLVAAANQSLPANPFPKGSSSWQEADRLRRFLRVPREGWSRDLAKLHLSLSGSYLALWRWGQPKTRSGALDRSLRQAWEDRLLEGSAPVVVKGLAFRHALCFALAEGDVDRFTGLKARFEEDSLDYLLAFQKAFSLLGAAAPVVRLWKLPAMEPVDLSLGQLGGRSLRFEMDPGTGLPAFPAGTVWVVPTSEGSLPEASLYLEGDSLEEAERLVPRLQAAGRIAYLAPSRSVLEAYALMYFPLQMDLDEQGTVIGIRMGDAALAKF